MKVLTLDRCIALDLMSMLAFRLPWRVPYPNGVASSAAIFALCVTRKIRYAGIGLTACTVLGAYTHQYALIAEAYEIYDELAKGGVGAISPKPS